MSHKRFVVLASYRTGSTSLSNVLAKQNNVKNYDELFHRLNTHFNYNKLRTSDYIVKIMPDQIVEPYFTDIIRQSKIIGITRQNIAEQICSYFIALKTRYWHSKFHNIDLQDVEFSPHELQTSIDSIVKFNEDYQKNFKPLCEIEYIYEDIKDTLLKNSDYVSLTKPKNYQEILSAIGNLL